jgi:hypothetical protein
MRGLQEVDYVGTCVDAIRLVEAADDLVNIKNTIEEFQNVRGAIAQLDHAFRIQEHPGILSVLELQTHSATED